MIRITDIFDLVCHHQTEIARAVNDPERNYLKIKAREQELQEEFKTKWRALGLPELDWSNKE